MQAYHPLQQITAELWFSYKLHLCYSTWQVNITDDELNNAMKVRVVLERDDVRMVKFAQMSDVSFTLVSQLLDGHQLAPQLAEEHGALCTAAEPLQVRDVLKRDLPVIYVAPGRHA